MFNSLFTISPFFKRVFAFSLFCLLTVLVQGQSVNPRVVGSSGGTGTSAEATISWTIGEPVITTLVQPGSILSQGFHQSFGATATISVAPANATVCGGDPVELRVDFTGTGPWSFTYTDGTTSWLHSNVTDNPYIFNTDVAPVWVGPNPSVVYTYTITWVSQNGFMTPGSGSAVVTVFRRPVTGPMYHIPNLEGVYDIDGNYYPVINIGTQTWTMTNLKVTRYRNGDPIPERQLTVDWTSETNGAWCHYDNDATNESIYGKLYNQHAVLDARGLCPVGWRVPTEAEWVDIFNEVGGMAVAGGKLKSTSTAPDPHPRWDSPNTGANNEVGFSALPGGYRHPTTGAFTTRGTYGWFWTSTTISPTEGRYFYISYNVEWIAFTGHNKEMGNSVRCVRE
jgi:uncharacterized protein (TIGR02145 family)